MATPASIFPRRKTCYWEDVGGGLSANMCDDGSVFMYKDTATGESWFGTEKPPKKWRRQLQHNNFGAVEAGLCPPHPHVMPHPSAKIVRLQKALHGLVLRTGDRIVGVTADGLVGPRTVKAVNRALYMYAKGAAPSEFTTGALTHGQIVAFSSQLAAYIERSPIAASTRLSPATSPSLSPPPSHAAPAAPPISPPAQVPVQYSAGANMYPYGQYPGYYQPQPVYYSNRAPGGLPADQATVDVKAFIPAQYEHVQVDPMTVAAAIIIGVGIYIVATKKKTRRED